MRNFFEHQDRARRTTRWLVVLMILGVIAMGLAIYGVLFLFANVQSSAATVLGPKVADPQLLIACILGTGVIVAIASGTRLLSLRGGGAQVAAMLGGRLVSGQARDVLEKRLVNVVEEMAIASGVPVPQVFVLDGEEGINAFAAGYAPGDAAVAVTRGCLEKLTREELQGVIAHELSHVLNGDMRLNIRLMGIVFGIACIGIAGRLLMRASSSSRSTFTRRRRGSPGAAIFAFGLGVFLIGLLGEFFSKLIKAAVSRQREFLADASAVQFTRNPQGLAGALKKIGGWPAGARVGAQRAEEASHFFFGDIHKNMFSGGWLTTHPPLSDRIQRVDPTFRGQFPVVGPGIAEPEDSLVQAFASAGQHVSDPAGVVSSIGTAHEDDVSRAESLLQAMAPELRDAAHVPFSSVAIVFGLLLSEDPTVQRTQREQIHSLASASLDTEMRRLLSHVRDVPRARRLPLLSLLLPALRELSPEQRASFSHTVEALIDADHSMSIFEHVVAETLRMRLHEQSPAQRARTRHRTLVAVSAELQLVLSLVAYAGSSDGGAAQRAFAAGSARLKGLKLSLIPNSERAILGLSAALMELRALAPMHMGTVVDAAAHCVLADRDVTDDEAALLHAICDALDCPLPPWV